MFHNSNTEKILTQFMAVHLHHLLTFETSFLDWFALNKLFLLVLVLRNYDMAKLKLKLK